MVVTYDLSTNESRIRISDLEFGDEGTFICMAKVNGVVKSVPMALKVVGTLFSSLLNFLMKIYYTLFMISSIEFLVYICDFSINSLFYSKFLTCS